MHHGFDNFIGFNSHALGEIREHDGLIYLNSAFYRLGNRNLRFLARSCLFVLSQFALFARPISFGVKIFPFDDFFSAKRNFLFKKFSVGLRFLKLFLTFSFLCFYARLFAFNGWRWGDSSSGRRQHLNFCFLRCCFFFLDGLFRRFDRQLDDFGSRFLFARFFRLDDFFGGRFFFSDRFFSFRDLLERSFFQGFIFFCRFFSLFCRYHLFAGNLSSGFWGIGITGSLHRLLWSSERFLGFNFSAAPADNIGSDPSFYDGFFFGAVKR